VVTEITNGVLIGVEVQYQSEYSSPTQHHYVFSYRVTIENRGEFTVQLQRRNWDIIDSNGSHKIVEGEGVIGQKPILEPGESYTYVSGCNLTTEIGKMKGYYIFERQMDGQLFDVTIPEFVMFAPWRQN
jgi:ApaG protein